VFVLVVPLFAQEWSTEQSDAWASELAYWEAFAAGDVEKTLTYMHEDYQGWSYGDYLPSDKASTRKFFSHWFPKTETFTWEATPISIIVHGNVAVLHYIVSAHSSNEKGEHTNWEQRWTDTLIKEGDRWRLLGDHGGGTNQIGN